MAIVEFAFVAMIFFTLLLGIMEFGRWLFTLNAAAEATRWGARLAAVCSIGDSDIKEKMRVMLQVEPELISIDYAPSNCDKSNCETVTVFLGQKSTTDGVTTWVRRPQFTTLIPFLGGSYDIPDFTTQLPRELMNSDDNPVCE